MNQLRLPFASLIVLSSLAIACGDSTSGAGGGTSGTGTGSVTGAGSTGTGSSTQSCTDVTSARCMQLDSCSNTALTTSRYGTLQVCQARGLANCETSQAAPNTGTSPAAAEACATALGTESCDDFFNNNPPADCQAKMGTLLSGAPCSFAAQCNTGYCNTPHASVCGVCGAEPAVGAPCTIESDCDKDQTCVKATATCQTRVAQNGACGASAPCAAGLSCVGATMAAMGACKPAGATIGVACDPKKKTEAGCDGDKGLFCDSGTMLCAKETFAAPRQPCGFIGTMEVGCSAGGLCVIPGTAAAGTCIAPAADGAACDDTNGPPCLLPAKCVVSGGGTMGACTLPGGTACQ
jgi:hypothetical protein